MSKVYLVTAKRTPIGSFLGSLKGVEPGDLGALVIKNVIAQTGINPADLDEVVMGNVLHAGHKQGVGRQAAVKGGVPVEVPAYSINMICGSGLKSINVAYNEIKSGEANLILAGGVESMSCAGFVLPASVRSGFKMGDLKMKDHMVTDGLTDAFNDYHMGITAENIAEKYGITREEQDEFAMNSQRKAIAAVDGGVFDEEIIPVEVKVKKETVLFSRDEHPNRKSTPEVLAKLRPAFKKDGMVTAANASSINDGAAAIVVMSEEKAKELGVTPMATWVAGALGGVDPSIMGIGPVASTRKVLAKTGMEIKDFDLIEANEAFAAQSLAVGRDLGFDTSKLNVNGGAIALGHPVGASGCRILVTLLHEMAKRDAKTGLATLCIGGGMGCSTIVKRD